MSDQKYVVNEVPFENPRPIRVVCLGAGFSGLCLALRIQQRCENVELVIYEKNADIGGTWLENVYPGAACDVPSHIYSYSFLPKHDWNEHYAPSAEILAYINECADKFKARQFIQCSSKITSAIWDEESGKWNFDINQNGQTIKDSAEIFINGGGFLNNWKWPQIPGMDSFKGKMLHSAAWDQSYDYANKDVCVIGSGSSALQLIPNLHKSVKHLDAYIRSPTYIPEPMAFSWLEEQHSEDYAGDRKYTEADKQRFKTDPEYWLNYRKHLESGFNGFFDAFLLGSPAQAALKEHAMSNMKKLLANKPELLEFMTPKWEVGCRRLSPGLGFLETLGEANVDVINTNIESITPTGTRTTDGKERSYEAICCATGFDVSFKPRFLMRGKDGFELDDKWAAEPRSYMTIAIENMPNYFIYNGPYCCTGNGSVIPCIEHETDYMIQCINKIQRQNIKSMTVQTSAVEEFSEHADVFMPRSSWASNCNSWYKTKSGRVVGVWPGTSLTFHELMKRPRYEDYTYTYNTAKGSKPNRFSFLGNGYTKAHYEGSKDLAEYLNDPQPATL